MPVKRRERQIADVYIYMYIKTCISQLANDRYIGGISVTCKA